VAHDQLGGEQLKKPELDAVLDKVVASVVRQAQWRVAAQ
jgi:hypothetical protein